MKNYLLFFTVVIFFGSCRQNLEGHWHGTIQDLPDHFSNFISFDLSYTQPPLFVANLIDEPIHGELSPDKNVLFFSGECGSLSFKYKINGNKMYLKNALGVKVTAERIINCNRINDYKSKNLPIELLKDINTDKTYLKTYDQETSHINLTIGYNKHNQIALDSWTTSSSKPIDSLKNILINLKESYTDDDYPNMHYIITPDKNLKGKVLNSIIKTFHKDSIYKIYLRSFNSKFTDSSKIFKYTRIKTANFDNEKTLTEIFN